MHACLRALMCSLFACLQALWQHVLDTALSLTGVDALLDCGALLSGASNRCDAFEYKYIA